MVEKETLVGPEASLHARPAAMFVKKAKEFDSDIKVVKEGREANAKSTLKVMTMGAKKDDSILIRAEGEAAVDALVAILSEEEEE